MLKGGASDFDFADKSDQMAAVVPVAEAAAGDNFYVDDEDADTGSGSGQTATTDSSDIFPTQPHPAGASACFAIYKLNFNQIS